MPPGTSPPEQQRTVYTDTGSKGETFRDTHHRLLLQVMRDGGGGVQSISALWRRRRRQRCRWKEARHGAAATTTWSLRRGAGPATTGPAGVRRAESAVGQHTRWRTERVRAGGGGWDSERRCRTGPRRHRMRERRFRHVCMCKSARVSARAPACACVVACRWLAFHAAALSKHDCLGTASQATPQGRAEPETQSAPRCWSGVLDFQVDILHCENFDSPVGVLPLAGRRFRIV